MLGAVAGDVIASPYDKSRSLSFSDFISFRLFEPVSSVSYRNRYSGEVKQSLDDVDHRRQRQWDAVMTSSKVTPTAFTDSLMSVVRLLAHHDLGTGSAEVGTVDDEMAVAVVAARYGSDPAESLRLASSLAREAGLSDLKCSLTGTYAMILHKARNVSSPEELDAVFQEHHQELFSGCAEASENLEKSGTDLLEGFALLCAAGTACAVSSSFEESVRRAATVSGGSSRVAALAGFIASGMYGGVPDRISSEVERFVPSEDLRLLSDVQFEADRSDRKVAPVTERFRALSVKGETPVWVVREADPHIEDALKSHCRRLGMPFRMIRPAQLDEMLVKMSVARDDMDIPLTGTYMEYPRAEVKDYWLQDGKVKSSTTRSGKAVYSDELLPAEKRSMEFSAFQELKDFAENLRSELEDKAGVERVPGMHAHFASAFYPVVYDRSIDLMEGDILRGRVKLDEDGRIRVDTKVSTGSLAGEYLEGVLSSMDVFPRNASAAEIRQILNEYCLDYGKIEDEDERIALQGEGPEADSVRMKYVSNVDKAIMDVASEVQGLMCQRKSPSEFDFEDHTRILEFAEQTIDSRESYRGRSYQDVLYSRSHPGAVFTIGHSNMSMDEFSSLLMKYGIDNVVDIRSFPKSEYCPHFNGGVSRNGESVVLADSLKQLGISYSWLGPEMGGHVSRPDDQKRSLYVMETSAGESGQSFGVFRSDAECLDFCRRFNAGMRDDQRIEEFFVASEDRIEWLLGSGRLPQAVRKDVFDYCGRYLTYEEVMSRDSFKDALKDIRNAARNGSRIAVLCSEMKPEECHRFAMVGRALAHPADRRNRPVEVLHIQRNGELVSQGQLESRMLKAMNLSDDPRGLEKAFSQKGTALQHRKRDDVPIRLSRRGQRKRR